jgi:hypothetical protein
MTKRIVLHRTKNGGVFGIEIRPYRTLYVCLLAAIGAYCFGLGGFALVGLAVIDARETNPQ